jgi:hypothetical protein
MGILEELEAQGIDEGDTVRVRDCEFTWLPDFLPEDPGRRRKGRR